jgi:hypothetical protein
MKADKPIVVLVSKNLVFLPRIEAAAGSTLKVRRLTNLDLAETLIKENEIKAIIVDLEEEKSLWKPALRKLNKYLHETKQNVISIAYGPHEDTKSMHEAQEMGCEHTLAKGAFVNQIRSLLHP